jgi:hypothetical protein
MRSRNGWVIQHSESPGVYYQGDSITGFARIEDATVYDTPQQAECWQSALAVPSLWRVIPYMEAVSNG